APAQPAGRSPALCGGGPPPAPRPRPAISGTTVIGREVDGRSERWLMDAHRMQRGITVEVYRAPEGGGPAPSLYLRDGVGSELPSGLMQWRAAKQLADQNVHLVIPTGAQGSM